MKKEQQAIKKIINIIASDDFLIGSTLPSERKLSELSNVSRNTVRSALHKLEAKGIIDIRPNSGCYLLCKDRNILDWLENNNIDPIKEISDFIEARYFFEPYVIFMAAKKINKNTIHLLGECLIQLSQALISMEKEAVARKDEQFRRLIYCSSNNRFLIFTMSHLIKNNQYFFDIIDLLTDIEKDGIFADYVSLLNGLKQKNAFLVKKIAEENILRMSELLVKYQNIKLTEFIQETMKM
ncbi:MAG: FadR family transcriptional regulator [Desulfobacula sp.]|jgi:GntR family transcriptional regulator, transcriptional repressor for pyruvate dehydrogenase complex|nr:FadR family transcriptional regulator [Desulfobacula sp.]